MKIEKFLNERNIWMLSLALAALMLLAIPAIRIIYFDSLLPGETGYYNLKIAKHISKTGDLNLDFIGRPYLPNPYHILLSVLGLQEASAFSIFLSFVFGILSVILFNLILRKLGLGLDCRLMIIIIFIISPIFIFAFSALSQYSFAIALFLAGFYSFIHNNKRTALFSIAIFFIFSFFGLLSMLFAAFALISFSLYNKKKIKLFYPVIAIFILIALVYYFPFYYKFGIPNGTGLIEKSNLAEAVSDLGGINGFGVFTILLSFFGMYFVWNNKKLIIPYVFVIASLIISFYYSQFNFYLNLVLPLFAGMGFVTISKIKWNIKTIKSLTILIIICGLLFSTVSYLNRTSSIWPDKNIIKGLQWLDGNSKKEDIVFSHYSNGFWIEYYGNREAFLDSSFDYIPELNTRINDSDSLFYSRNLKKTTDIIDKYKIKYIFIDPEMRYGKVWSKENQGLLFLFMNEDAFQNVYSNNGVEIWEVIRGK